MASPYGTGGIPDNTDVVVGSVFIAVFALSGTFFHLRAFHAYGYKFHWSLLIFAFCVGRILAIGFRIALKDNPTSKVLACITQIFIAAGIAFLFNVNLQMSRRFFGQFHPRHSVRVQHIISGACFLIDPLMLIVIFAIIQSFTTTDPNILQIDRKLRIVACSFLTALAFLPIPIVTFALVLPKVPLSKIFTIELGGHIESKKEKSNFDSNTTTPDLSRSPSYRSMVIPVAETPRYQFPKGKKGKGQLNSSFITQCLKSRKGVNGVPETGFGSTPICRSDIIGNAATIIVPATLFTFMTAIRTTQAHYIPVIGTSPPWFMSKAAFWVCIFGLESVAVIFLGLASLPRRFTHLNPI